MTRETFDEAVAEARRFLAIAEKVEWETVQYDWANKDRRLKPNLTGHTHAAAKRASMDLTRALARMRKGPHE